MLSLMGMLPEEQRPMRSVGVVAEEGATCMMPSTALLLMLVMTLSGFHPTSPPALEAVSLMMSPSTRQLIICELPDEGRLTSPLQAESPPTAFFTVTFVTTLVMTLAPSSRPASTPVRMPEAATSICPSMYRLLTLPARLRNRPDTSAVRALSPVQFRVMVWFCPSKLPL